MIKIKFKDLQELNIICWCIEFALKEDRIYYEDREKVKKMAERLREELKKLKN